MRRLALSHSRLQRWMRCRAAFRLRYLDRMPAVVTPEWFGGGRLLHEVAQVYVEERVVDYLAGGPATPEPEARETHVRDVVARLWPAREPSVGSRERDEIDALAVRLALRLPLDPDAVVACELPVALTWDLRRCDWRSPDVWWRAKLDRLDQPAPDQVRVCDLKFGYARESDPLQMDIYAAVVAAINPAAELITVEVYHVRHDRLDSRDLERGEALAVWDDARAASEAIERDRRASEGDRNPHFHWPATPGRECGICDVACPLVDVVPEPWRPVQTRQDAERAAGEVIALGRALGLRRKALRAWAAENGPVLVGGKVFEHRERLEWLATAGDVLGLGEEAGLEAWELLPLLRGPGSEQMKAIRDDGPLGEVAAAIRERYSAAKPGWSERKEQDDDA